MQSMNKIPVLQQEESAPRRISRRELAQTLLAGVAAGFISPISSAVHPIHKHLLNTALLDSADARVSTAGNKPLFLSAQQFAAIDVLSEAIVPGSRNAHAAAFIDLLLSVDTQEVQQKFLAALAAFKSISQSGYHVEIIALTPPQLQDVLIAASHAGSPDHPHFDHLKVWIAGAYYSSEIGMRELGWTPDRVFSTFPGCLHPDGHR
jgi:Gluconate 2-dehydrogenase subunit 3